MFPAIISIVLGLPFSPMIHFKLIFVYGARYGPKLIFLHMDIQLFQHNLLTHLFSTCILFALLYKNPQLFKVCVSISLDSIVFHRSI